MNTQERQLIDHLFERLKKASEQSPYRDDAAEQKINQHLSSQGHAGYYMTQVLLVQEETLKQAQAKIAELEQQLQERPKEQGGFLSGLFGLNAGQPSASQNAASPSQGAANASSNAWGRPTPAPAYQPGAESAGQSAFGRGGFGKGAGGSFLGGALQTAAGVAGGMLLAESLGGLFGHHGSVMNEEIVNVYNEAPQQESNADSSFADNGNNWADASDYSGSQDDYGLGGGNDDFGSGFDFGDDDWT
ncbi:DUF2076 domain-containing protein [Pokkaliibacter sp. CJK22405]|uniref:DUF2076 domain-containing protein n=1 Tax=Pokkaliibacter sp. CJK22405 TaxID=3384615 RepID=UPI0039855798